MIPFWDKNHLGHACPSNKILVPLGVFFLNFQQIQVFVFFIQCNYVSPPMGSKIVMNKHMAELGYSLLN